MEVANKLRDQIVAQSSARFSCDGVQGEDDLTLQVLQEQLHEIEEALASLNRMEP